ncbi:hypothetical protein LX59_00948 [Azomonas agilis]|uniref:Uncharacterized protein n=1 Tax=Azomonas agilis TaxID=116849 RepID=A0A562J169_9GAMM|nr:hypothetical protein [Azomonas agilis]TWH76902.1 hypothetical protein LX59_00948 [Azomonas agilis]
MSQETVLKRLWALDAKYGLSIRTQLLVRRRLCRVLSELRHQIQGERQAQIRAARLQLPKNPTPFDQARIKRLEQTAKGHRIHEFVETLRQQIRLGGDLIINQAIYDSLGLDELLVLLNINPADQAWVLEQMGDEPPFFGLVFVPGSENSTSREAQRKEHGPLLEACLSSITEVMRHPDFDPEAVGRRIREKYKGQRLRRVK